MLSTIPCRNKKPLVPWKTYQVDPPTEAEWQVWTQQWPDAQKALICGRVSGGICVLDVDDVKVAEEMATTQRGITRMHRTPSGGLHCLVREMDGVSPSKPLVPGRFDMKANGGYIIIPPSPGYEVVDESEILEVSSGEGYFLEWLKKMGYGVTVKSSSLITPDEMFKDGKYRYNGNKFSP